MKTTHKKCVARNRKKPCIQIFCHEFVKLNEATAQEKDGEKTEGYESQVVKTQGSAESKIKSSQK